MRQVRWSGNPVSFKNFPQFVVIHTVKDFSIVSEADFFFWNSLIFSMIQWILATLSLAPLPETGEGDNGLDGHEFEQTLGDGEGLGSLV